MKKVEEIEHKPFIEKIEKMDKIYSDKIKKIYSDYEKLFPIIKPYKKVIYLIIAEAFLSGEENILEKLPKI